MNQQLNIPKINGAYLNAYIEIGNKLLSDPTIQAAILSSSLLESTPDINSDIDIVAITSGDFWQRKQLSTNGIFAEIFLYSEKELLRSFDEGDYQDMNMVAYGFNMFDRTCCVEKLKEKAKKLYERGPGIPNEEKVTYLKYLVWDNYCDVVDILIKDKNGATALMNKSIWYALEIFFALQGQWFCKPKKLFRSVEVLNEEVFLLLGDFYSADSRDIDHLFKVYCNIISAIITPYDLNKHFVWNSDKHVGSYKII